MNGSSVPKLYSSYIGTSPEEQKEMLETIGKSNIEELFSDIPKDLILDEFVDIPGPYSEKELDKLFHNISRKNKVSDTLSFLGGGVRQVYIPAFLEELMRRGEIYTAYTSYQPEVAQGMLQMVFEYESQLAELTGMDVINASLYDWASAVGEAFRMMVRIKRKRDTILVLNPISPKRLKVASTYTDGPHIRIKVIESEGDIDVEAAKKLILEDSALDKKERKLAGIYFEVPTYHGVLPSKIDELIKVAHENKLLVTVGVDVISLGIIKPPGDYGADFVVGEGQLLGNGVSAGGPLLGILGSKYDRKWIQNFPGRLVGITKDERDGDDAYCITLSTREQHIRREKATSNICSNQTLMAVNAGIYLAGLGPKGIEELAQGLMDRAAYLADGLEKLGYGPQYKPFFSEFVVDFGSIDHEDLEAKFLERGIAPGTKIKGEGCRRLLAVSDLMTREDLDKFLEVTKEVLK